MNVLAEALCPKCSTRRPARATECPQCGVIYDRYQARPKASPAAPAQAPLAAAPLPRPSAQQPRTFVPLARQEAFFLQVAELLEAGISQRQALLSGILLALPAPVAQHLQRGAEQDLPLSESLAPLKVLDEATLAMLHAGERRGALPQTLRHLSRRIADYRADRFQLMAVLAYPAFVIFSSTLIRPAPLLFTAGPSAYFQAAFPPALFVLGVIGAYLRWPRLAPDSPLRQTVRRLGLQLPLVRGIMRDGAYSTFAEVLGSGIASGLPAREAVRLAAKSSPLPSLSRSAAEMVRRLDEGTTLTEALSAGELPPLFLAQINAAEHAGTLDEALPRLSKSHRETARRTTRAVLIGLGTLVLLVTALAMALSIISSYTGGMRSQEQLFDKMMRE